MPAPDRVDSIPTLEISGTAWHGIIDEQHALIVLESERGQIALKLPRDPDLLAAFADAAVRLLAGAQAARSGELMARAVDRFSVGHSPDRPGRVILSLGQGSTLELDSYMMGGVTAKQMGAALVRQGIDAMKGLPPDPQARIVPPLKNGDPRQ